MKKMNREIDQLKLNIIKERSIDNVLETIKVKRFSFLRKRSLSFVFMMFLVVLTIPFAIKLNNGFVPVNAEIDEDILSTLAYVSTAMLNDEIDLANSYNIVMLSDIEEALIENELDDVNIYFDKLKYFIDETVPFENIVLNENEDSSPYLYTITFTLDEVLYTMNFNIIDDSLTGEINFSDKTFVLSGTYINTESEQFFEIESISGSDYMSVKLQTENTGDESKLKLEIHSRIANQERTKTVEVKDEFDEQIVIVTEGENEFKLKKEINENYTYKFEYKIGTTNGTLEVTESVDELGNQEYRYTINENGNVKEIIKQKPDNVPGNDNNPGNDNDPGNNNTPGNGI